MRAVPRFGAYPLTPGPSPEGEGRFVLLKQEN